MPDLSTISLASLVTPAGIVAAGVLVRYFVEVVKSFITWVDAGNERKVAIGTALVLYAAWYLAYGAGQFATNGWTAVMCWLAVSVGALGTDSAINAAQGQLANVVAKATVTAQVAPATTAAPDPAPVLDLGAAVDDTPPADPAAAADGAEAAPAPPAP